jgi:hypothetical protein
MESDIGNALLGVRERNVYFVQQLLNLREYPLSDNSPATSRFIIFPNYTHSTFLAFKPWGDSL